MAGMVVINGGKNGGASAPSGTEKQGAAVSNSQPGKPSAAQARYLKMGLDQAGGKLPLFDESGQEIKPATIRSCIEKGWAEPWFNNPVKPDWLVCKLTDAGRAALGK